jgi:hypothetical protein
VSVIFSRSLTIGSLLAERLAWGRLFACTRVREMSPATRIAWDLRSPHQTEDGEFVAQLMQLTRLPIDLPTGWVHGRSAE